MGYENIEFTLISLVDNSSKRDEINFGFYVVYKHVFLYKFRCSK